MINEERGTSWTEKVMKVMANVLVWCGLLTRTGSVLKPFRQRKLFSSFFISSKQVVRVDSNDDDGSVKVFMNSCLSSA